MCFFEILVMGVSFHLLYCGWLLPRIYLVKGKSPVKLNMKRSAEVAREEGLAAQQDFKHKL